MTLFSAGQDRLEFDWKRHNRENECVSLIFFSFYECM